MAMPPRVRKLVLAVHLTVSIGWIGAIAAYIALDLAVALGTDAETIRVGYLGMDRIARLVIVPLAMATIVTGVVISLGTKWGLFRHYWVVISLLLTLFATVVLLRETRVIELHADVAADPTVSLGTLARLGSTLVHSMGGIAVLLVVLVLNVYKPRGLTKHGRRTEAGEVTPAP